MDGYLKRDARRSGGKAHLFGRRDRSFRKKVALMWLNHKRIQSGVKVLAQPEKPRANLLRAIFRVNHCGLFNVPTNRNSDRSNVVPGSM